MKAFAGGLLARNWGSKEAGKRADFGKVVKRTKPAGIKKNVSWPDI